jgi:hypothetical protein
MRPKHSLDRRLTLKAEWWHDLTGSMTAQPAGEMRGECWDVRRTALELGKCERKFWPFLVCCLLPPPRAKWKQPPRAASGRWRALIIPQLDRFATTSPLVP